eukprot:g1637.t1
MRLWVSTGEALAVLLENLDLPLLENLSLVQARLVDSSLQVLGSWWSKGPSVPLPKLRSMDLSGNFVSSEALRSLRQTLQRSEHFRQLKGSGRLSNKGGHRAPGTTGYLPRNR